jgi:putative peptide zinc metalloprotease protein
LKINDESKVKLHRFFWRKEDGFYTVWREEGSDFAELSEDSLEALKLLKRGRSLREVSETLEQNYDEDYDIVGFVSELMKLGFVSSIDGIPIPAKTIEGRTFQFIGKRHVGWIYSKPLLFTYTVLILFATMIFASNPAYLPKYSDYFFHESYLVSLIASILTGLVLVFSHEFAHLIAGKSVGVDGYLSVSMRLYIPVAETNLTRLWSVPKRKRYVPFIAGMLNDGVVLAILVILLWLSDLRILRMNSLYSFARFAILILLYGISWQFLFFVRTDIYYAVLNLLGCRNLYDDAWSLILNTLFSPFGKRRPKLDIPPRELRAVKIYAPFMLVGTVTSILIFVLFGLPILTEIFIQAFAMLNIADLSTFIEGLIITSLVLTQIAGFTYFSVRTLNNLRTRAKQQKADHRALC